MRVAQAASLLALLASCSSSASDASGGALQPYVASTNGVAMDADVACGQLFDAYQGSLGRLGCTGTAPLCPGFLKSFANSASCLTWDAGSIDDCAQYYARFTSCDGLSPTQCVPSPAAAACGADAGHD